VDQVVLKKEVQKVKQVRKEGTWEKNRNIKEIIRMKRKLMNINLVNLELSCGIVRNFYGGKVR